MDELYEARNSIYCYPNSNVLINKLDLKNAKRLEKAEKMIVLAKLYDLRQGKIKGNFDKAHFISIHKYLFEDLYPFAGEFRKENIAKDSFSFAEWEFIESELDRLLIKLKEERSKALISKKALVQNQRFKDNKLRENKKIENLSQKKLN